MSDPERNAARIARIVEMVASRPAQKQMVATARRYLENAAAQDVPPNEMQWVRRIYAATSPHVRARLITNMATWMRSGPPRQERFAATGGATPFVVLTSPTMRCNLKCTGCYASQYDRKSDLPLEVVERLANEARDLGSFGMIMLGGEPLMAHGMLDLFDHHPDLTFMVFTNGTLVTDAVAERLARAGNVLVSVSVDGFPAEHEVRRGRGTFRKTGLGMAALRAAGVPFGFSTMVTRQNCLGVTSDAFADWLIELGCLWGWHFMYMPVGDDPDLDLMPTPEQREYLRVNGAQRIRSTKPLLVVDFWNDAPYVGGCIAGRQYLHVTSSGDVEPCIFTHFATDNIKDTSLADILRSPFFANIRARQPYSPNLLRPCMLIDETHVIRDVVATTGAHPTHAGAETLLTTLRDGIDSYSAGWKKIADEAWARTQHPEPVGCPQPAAVTEPETGAEPETRAEPETGAEPVGTGVA